MKMKYPDYTNSAANLANSILEIFDIHENGRSGLTLFEPYVKSNYENIVVLLLDGMGNGIMDKNLSQKGFFQIHKVGTYSSVFPPTTVAATTSIMSGLQPCQHKWLGWDNYYPQIQKNVTVFTNNETGTDRPAADYNVSWTYCGYENIVETIRRHGGNAYQVTPFTDPYPSDFESICNQIERLCTQEGKKYIYSYWNEPDHIMHEAGCYAKASKQTILELEQRVKDMCERLSDTLLIVTADHGHMDSKGVSITDYPHIMDCLIRMPSIEPRALNLYVKKEKKVQFEKEFLREFQDKFLLLTKKQVLEKKLFGTAREDPEFADMLGDYLAIAVDDLSIYSSKEESEFYIGMHAGLTEDEMEIPFIVIEC